MKRLLIFWALCLGVLGEVVAQEAKDTIYLTYKLLSPEDTMTRFELWSYIAPQAGQCQSISYILGKQ